MINSEYLADLAYVYGGEWPRIARAIEKKEQPLHTRKYERYITICDEDYPEVLKKLRYPPWVLFYEGNIELLKEPMMTIVGSRNLTDYGKRMTCMVSSILKKKYVLVSGLAKGADALVHEEALHGGKTIAVIGNGLGTHYPSENDVLYQKIADTGLILSEYPFHSPPYRHHFPWRNRILACLGESTVVTQAKEHSGTMITVNEALNLGKDIYCVPYPLEDENGTGCNRLIEEGAGMLYTKEQLYDLIL